MAIRAFFLPYFARWAQYGLFFALFRPLGSIRAFFSPYCRWQYGLFFCPISPVGLNTGFWRPISLALNTGSWRLLPVGQYAAFPGLRYAYPGLCSGAHSHRQIDNARHVGRLFSLACHQRPPRRASILPRMPSTPATSGVYSPLHAINARRGGRLFSLACHQRPPRRASIHPCMPSTPAAAGVHPPSPFMERGWPTGRGGGQFPHPTHHSPRLRRGLSCMHSSTK